MKKLAIILCACMVVMLCIGCGPYTDYAGTYVNKMTDLTVTITLSASGGFKYEREYSKGHSMKNGPYDSDKYNKFSGKYEIKESEIAIEFEYYDDIEGYKKGRATAKIVNDKLVISGHDRVNGTYARK